MLVVLLLLLLLLIAISCGVSAGVGRTGAFVVIDSMLERLKHVRTVDIYGHVTCLRAQRNYMVQTEDQYVFIHDAVLEAIQSGNTEIPARGLYAHVHRMSERPADSVGGATGIQMEYRVCAYTCQGAITSKIKLAIKLTIKLKT